MAGRFEGQVAWITGASSGIGAALAVEFARQGARVVVSARRAELLETVCGRIRAVGGEALAVPCDVCDRASQEAAVARAVEVYGRLDVAVANAGFGVSGRFTRLTTEDFRRQFETNVFGLLDTAYAALPQLRATRGRLVLVSSILGYVGSPSTAPYCGSKFAVRGVAESLYYELVNEGVSVTCICPGLVESGIRMTDNEGVFHEDRKDPAPAWLVMPANRAARKIADAVYRRKAEAIITGHGKMVVAFYRHFPRTFRALGRWFTRGRLDRVETMKRGPQGKSG